VLYLLDASVVITAKNAYYPIEQVPEFWSWLSHQGARGNVKIPDQILDEILAGSNKDDPLFQWIRDADNRNALRLDEEVDPLLVQRTVRLGYGDDLTDDEVEQLGRDPFLPAYALSDLENRCVVTTEVSKPAKQRQNRRLPDVCETLGVPWCGPFELNRVLGFTTNWRQRQEE